MKTSGKRKGLTKARMVKMIRTSKLENDMLAILEVEPMSSKKLASTLNEDPTRVSKACDALKGRDAIIFCTNTGTYKISVTKHNSMILAKPWGSNRTMRIKTYY